MDTNDEELEANLRKLPLTKLKRRCKILKLSPEGSKLDIIKRILERVKISRDATKLTPTNNTQSDTEEKQSNYRYLPSLSSGVYGSYPSTVYRQYERSYEPQPTAPTTPPQHNKSSKQWIYHPTQGYICITDSELDNSNIINLNAINQLLHNETNQDRAVHTLALRLPFTPTTNRILSANMISDLISSQKLAFSQSTPAQSPHAQLVFIRHGQSEWNASNRFTGWVDVGLTDLGREEALQGGMELLKAGYIFDIMYTSYLRRAIMTGNMVLEVIDQLYIPVVCTWRLNERMYGGLQGLNKVKTVQKYGAEQVLKWRRSFDIPPPKIEAKSKYNPAKDKKYKKLKKKDIPRTECLKDVIERVLPFWKSDIKAQLEEGKSILIAAHGNSIRAIVKYLDDISDEIIPSLEIPTGIPLVYEFDKNLRIIKNKKAVQPLTGLFLGDPQRIKKAQEKVKNQIKS